MTKAMLTLVVFGMAIVSGFAMDTNPPTEPVKVVVETEVAIADFGYGYQNDLGECILLEEGILPSNCSILNTGIACMDVINGVPYHLREFTKNPNTNQWECENFLYVMP